MCQSGLCLEAKVPHRAIVASKGILNYFNNKRVLPLDKATGSNFELSYLARDIMDECDIISTLLP